MLRLFIHIRRVYYRPLGPCNICKFTTVYGPPSDVERRVTARITHVLLPFATWSQHSPPSCYYIPLWGGLGCYTRFRLARHIPHILINVAQPTRSFYNLLVGFIISLHCPPFLFRFVTLLSRSLGHLSRLYVHFSYYYSSTT